MKVIINLNNLTTQITDSTPFIQGIDNVRNKVELYVLNNSISDVTVNYTYPNGRNASISMSNDGAEETLTTIGSQQYQCFYFYLPEIATVADGQLLMTFVLTLTNSNKVKFNVTNVILNSSNFEMYESALSAASTELLNRIDAMSNSITGAQTNISNHNTRITALELDKTQYTHPKIELLNEEVFGEESGTNPNSDGLKYIVRTDHEDRIQDLEDYKEEIDPIIQEVGDQQADIQALEEDNESNKDRLDDLEEGRVKTVDIVDDLTHTDTNKPLSANQGKVLKGLIDAINNLLESDDTTLDELQEIVDYIKTNKELIDAITLAKVNVTDIIDNLTSQIANKPLSANQGYILKGLVDELTTAIGSDNTSNTVKGRVKALEDDNTSNKSRLTSLESGKADKSTTYTKSQVDTIIQNLVNEGYAIDWEDLCDIYNEVYADDPLMAMLDTINGEVI